MIKKQNKIDQLTKVIKEWDNSKESIHFPEIEDYESVKCVLNQFSQRQLDDIRVIINILIKNAYSSGYKQSKKRRVYES